jgi:hypothetical protein
MTLTRTGYNVVLVRPGLEYASCVLSPHQEVHSARIDRIQHDFIRFALQRLNWTTHPASASWAGSSK